MESRERALLALARVKLIADIALENQRKNDELQLILSLVSDIARSLVPDDRHDDIFYEANGEWGER